jgi:Ala-tRNA(Pro) deacylase
MDLISLLEAEGVPYEQHEHPPIFTAQELAQIEHVPGHNVAKPVLVRDEQGYVMCVLPASGRIDLQSLRETLGSADLKLADEAELTAIFPGCELGAEPPIGPLFGLRTVADYALMDDDYVEFQAGTHTRSVRIAREDFERLADPSYGNLCEA